ncbi:uncharacterized protein LOC133500590 isoform X2 [Syngnathoides biaculeatus]|uniref:uncharacterized protein LOC133500590 isoform X2 n=1 Tax=Syngnathoides biaculeatus TaxID=300417 RepID=UPI002ADE8DD5|nr:uncharacterized protein LOC133500590 isoform X2 [Syngnathoides biaculeatus]
MATVVTLRGRMVLDVEDEGSRMVPATIQLIEQAVNNERKRVRGKQQGRVESPVLAPGAELAGDGGTTSAGSKKLMKKEVSRKLFEGQRVQSEEREMLEEVMTGTRKHGQAMPSDADHREEEMESDEEDEVVLREQRKMLRALREGERLGDREESMSRAERGYNMRSKGKMMAQQEQPQTMAPLVVTHAGRHYEPLVLGMWLHWWKNCPPLCIKGHEPGLLNSYLSCQDIGGFKTSHFGIMFPDSITEYRGGSWHPPARERNAPGGDLGGVVSGAEGGLSLPSGCGANNF